MRVYVCRYEAAFGPFYRVEQLILSLPEEQEGSIVKDEYVDVLWKMQEVVDAISGRPAAP